MLRRFLVSNATKDGIRCCSNRSKKLTTDLKVDVLSEQNTGIYVISFDRPNVRNAVNRNMVQQISETLDDLSFKKEVRVIIFHSTSPNVFCSGADLKERQQLSLQETYQFVSRFRSVTNQIESTPVPIIAAVDGFALGGGLEIALACDIRVASTNARFGLIETKLGIIPGAGGTQRLPRIAGPAVAKELIFTGRIIDAKTAENYGILNHVVEQDDSEKAALNKALEIAQEILPNGPIGVKLAKTAINKGLQVDLNTGCAIEESCYAQVISTKDRLEGIAAFLNKRSPKYTGE